MRDWWYGDKRDLVKWGTLVAVAREHSIGTVLQVAFYRPDRSGYHLSRGGRLEPLPPEVIRHFRDLNLVQSLAEMACLNVEIFNDNFQWSSSFKTKEDFRRAYFREVTKRICLHPEPILVFLDPDTGIAPASYDYKHVTPAEIRSTYDGMRQGDILVFYQHARRGDGSWQNTTHYEFSKAVGMRSDQVEIVTCDKIAKDVAFFVVPKSIATNSAVQPASECQDLSADDTRGT